MWREHPCNMHTLYMQCCIFDAMRIFTWHCKHNGNMYWFAINTDLYHLKNVHANSFRCQEFAPPGGLSPSLALFESTLHVWAKRRNQFSAYVFLDGFDRVWVFCSYQPYGVFGIILINGNVCVWGCENSLPCFCCQCHWRLIHGQVLGLVL